MLNNCEILLNWVKNRNFNLSDRYNFLKHRNIQGIAWPSISYTFNDASPIYLSGKTRLEKIAINVARYLEITLGFIALSSRCVHELWDIKHQLSIDDQLRICLRCKSFIRPLIALLCCILRINYWTYHLSQCLEIFSTASYKLFH